MEEAGFESRSRSASPPARDPGGGMKGDDPRGRPARLRSCRSFRRRTPGNGSRRGRPGSAVLVEGTSARDPGMLAVEPPATRRNFTTGISGGGDRFRPRDGAGHILVGRKVADA